MQSPEAWKYAQRLSSRKMVLCGIVGSLLFIMGWIMGLKEGILAVLMLATLVISVVYMIVSVERNLKRKFPDDRD